MTSLSSQWPPFQTEFNISKSETAAVCWAPTPQQLRIISIQGLLWPEQV